MITSPLLTALKNSLSTDFIRCTSRAHERIQAAVGAFLKVGECLYRYSSSGVYYVRIKSSGKEIRRSLETTDPALAQGNLRKLRNEQSQIDRLRVASRFASCATLTSKQFSTKSRKRSSGRHTS